MTTKEVLDSLFEEFKEMYAQAGKEADALAKSSDHLQFGMRMGEHGAYRRCLGSILNKMREMNKDWITTTSLVSMDDGQEDN